jgi:hypothetical protein
MDAMERYTMLLDLARRESELIAAGRWSELVDLEHERRELIATLPSRPPAEARGVLEEAKAIVTRNVASIVEATDRTVAQLALVGRGKQAMAGYGGGPRASSFVDHTA